MTRQTVALDPATPVWVDAVEVERLATGKPEGEELLAAARLCRGEFLPDFEAPGAELFDDRVLGRRAASRADQLALLERAVQDARDREDAPAGSPRLSGGTRTWPGCMRCSTTRRAGW